MIYTGIRRATRFRLLHLRYEQGQWVDDQTVWRSAWYWDEPLFAPRDWWRGYTDEELVSACRKIRDIEHKPGEIVPLTNGELSAYVVWTRQQRVNGEAG